MKRKTANGGVASRRTGSSVPRASVLLTSDEVLEVTAGKLLAGRRPGGALRRVCTDSRAVRRGDLFVALPGERFDGHQFVVPALRQGAGAALIALHAWPGLQRDYDLAKLSLPVIGVADPLLALQELATHHRLRFDIPVVAVTGSNGKTTTKEMTAQVLAERWTLLKTEGNLNNRIGVPQTLFRLTSRHRAAVIEMGVDARGQTRRLAEIARPTIGIITNIGPDHLEFFGTLDASAEAKGELLDHLPEHGWAVLNADDPYFGYLAARARCQVISFGFGGTADVRAVNVMPAGRRGVHFDLILPGRARPTPVVLPVHGTHNLLNALAAAATGHVCGVTGARIARGLLRFRPAAMRSQIETAAGVTIINDCYNANPASMTAAVDLLGQMAAGRRTIAVLGDMLELGPTGPALHRDVGRYLVQRGISLLIACGGQARDIADGAKRAGLPESQIREVTDADAAASVLANIMYAGDVILVKGSRGMRLERVVEAIKGQAHR